MANKRITELPNATLPISTGVKFEAVQAGINVQVDADDMPGSGGGGSWGSITGTLSNQTDLQTALDAKLDKINSAGALTDGAAVTLTAAKHTLATDEATITFSITYTGDDIVVEITLTGTIATYTFPAGSLCVTEGVATGNNSLTISGTTGDKYILTTKKIGSIYYVVAKNFGQ